MTIQKVKEVETANITPTESLTINKSAYFILPLIGIRISQLENFINSYLYYDLNEFIGKSGNKKYVYINLHLENNILEDNKYFASKEITNINTIIYKFNFPERLYKDYNYFVEGKYSEFSETAKRILCNYSSGKQINKNSQMYGILYKTETRRAYIEELVGEKLPINAELLSIPDLEKEIYLYE